MTTEQTLREKFRKKFALNQIRNIFSEDIFIKNIYIDDVFDWWLSHLTADRQKLVESPAFKSLQTDRGQLDQDGIYIAVSRQALDEVLSALITPQQ